jgi:hypothetical protein
VPKFRKKPVVIEAKQYGGSWHSAMDIRAWIGGDKLLSHEVNGLRAIVIPTLEGDHTAMPGDWIIKGVKGEFYPCKPDIFALTYEPADA